MAQQDAGFVDKHIEKVAVGFCLLILGASVWHSFLGDRFAVNGLGPSELCQRVGEEAERTADAVRNARPESRQESEQDPSKDPVTQLAQWFGEDRKGLLEIARIDSVPGRTQPFRPLFISTTETAVENRHNLAQIVRPGVPVLSSRRTGFFLPDEKPRLADYKGEPPSSDAPVAVRNWVSVAAQVDLIEQDINFRSEDYPVGSYLEVVRVELQRRDERAPWAGWQEVEAYLGFEELEWPAIYSPETGQFKLGGLAEFRHVIGGKQDFIARPQLPPRSSGDRVTSPPIPYYPDPPDQKENDTSDRARQWLRKAKSALDGKRPFSEPDLDAAYVLLRAVIAAPDARQKDVGDAQGLLPTVKNLLRKEGRDLANGPAHRPDRMMPIVAHDLSAVPGHAYSYRMRYGIYNIYAGNRGELLDPTDAQQLVIYSDWSPASRAVRIESNVRFFLTDWNKKRDQLIVTVHKKSGRAWKSEDFKVRVGEEIGGRAPLGSPHKGTDFSTGAVCVDIDFNRRLKGKSEVVLVYAVKSDGRLQEAILSADRKADEDFRKLQKGPRTARR